MYYVWHKINSTHSVTPHLLKKREIESEREDCRVGEAQTLISSITHFIEQLVGTTEENHGDEASKWVRENISKIASKT